MATAFAHVQAMYETNSLVRQASEIISHAKISDKDALEDACSKLGFRVVYGSRLDFGHLDASTTIFVSPALPRLTARYWIASKVAEGLAERVSISDQDRGEFIDIVRTLLLMPTDQFQTRSRSIANRDTLATMFGVSVRDIKLRESLASRN